MLRCLRYACCLDCLRHVVDVLVPVPVPLDASAGVHPSFGQLFVAVVDSTLVFLQQPSTDFAGLYCAAPYVVHALCIHGRHCPNVVSCVLAKHYSTFLSSPLRI